MGCRESRSAPKDDTTASRRRRMDMYRVSASFDASTYARSSGYSPSSPPPVPSSSSTHSPPSVRLADNVRKDPPTKANCSSLGGATALGSGTHTDTQHTVTAEEVLDQFRDQFIEEVDAEAVVGDLLHNNIINKGDKRAITSTRDPRLQNQELHLCLKNKCTLDALMTVCDIMTAVRGNPKMLALGEAIKRRLETGATALGSGTHTDTQHTVTGDEVLLQRLCYMATGIKQLLISPDGGTFTLGNGDASLEFLPGAIEKNIHVRYAIILNGPFVLPAGYKPGSVIIYLNMEGATLLKPVQLFLSHWCIREEADDEETMKFIRAPHSLESGKKGYAFEELEDEANFTTRTNMGILTIREPHCLLCVETKEAKIGRYSAITFTRNISSDEALLFRIQLMCDSLEWNKKLTTALEKSGWQKSIGGIVPRFSYLSAEKPIAASIAKMYGSGWMATIEGQHEVEEADFLMPKGKSKSEMEEEVIIGRFPPCVCAKILFTSPEERRVTPALLRVDLLNANVHLTFSCTFKEEPTPTSPESLVSSGSSWVMSAHQSPTHTLQRTAEASVLTPTTPEPSRSAATPPSSPQADVVLCKPADVLRALNHQLDAHWWEFGTFLYVDRVIMEKIRQDKSDVGPCMLQLVEKWLAHDNRTGDRPRTWQTVIQAVKDAGNGLLAEQLAKRFGVQH